MCFTSSFLVFCFFAVLFIEGKSLDNDQQSSNKGKVQNVWPDYSCDQLKEQNCPPWAKELCKKSYLECGSQADSGSYNIFTTGYSDKIIWYSVNEAQSEISILGQSKIEPNLSFGAVDHANKNIYFVHEVQNYTNIEPKWTNSGAVSRWTLSKEIKGNSNIPALSKQEVFSSNGTAPAHVHLDTENRILHVTNYDYKSGTYAAYSLDNVYGKIQNNVYVDDFSIEIEQGDEDEKASHAHHAVTHGKFVYVVDLGLNKIMHYEIKEGNSIVKASPSSYSLPNGFGPRHMAITSMLEGDQKAYVLNEKQPYITVFNVDSSTGALTQKYSIKTLPIEHYPDPIGEYGAEVALHPNEKWLYVSHRGTGSIITYRVLENGFLVQNQIQPTSGTWPRHFKISMSGKLMFVSLQLKNKLEVYKIDQSSGVLERLATLESSNSPAYVGIF